MIDESALEFQEGVATSITFQLILINKLIRNINIRKDNKTFNKVLAAIGSVR